MTEPLRVLSSMATKAVLAELAQAYEASAGERVLVESVRPKWWCGSPKLIAVGSAVVVWCA